MTEVLRFLLKRVETFQQRHGAGWLGPFVDFYLGERMALDLAEACALPSLSADAARAPDDARHAYTAGLAEIARTIAAGLPGPDAEARSWQLLSVLSGAAAMARAADDEAARASILQAASKLAKALG